jgi:SAM-dependent methyltransferase
VCHPSVFDFFRTEVAAADIQGRSVLEVGSRDVNGTVRPFLMSLGAREYLGVDLVAGPGVDRTCAVEELASTLGEGSYDAVVTTEMLEHVRDWRSAISNLKRVVAPGGILVITTRSFGFPYHDFPGDYWRYEISDMTALFRDFEILKLVRDPEYPGVFLKCRKPRQFREGETSSLKLFSMPGAARADGVGDEEIARYTERMKAFQGTAVDVATLLKGFDWTALEERTFRRLWRELEKLLALLRGLSRKETEASTLERMARPIGRLKRRIFDLALSAGIVRGESLKRARKSLCASAGRSLWKTMFHVPWGSVEETSFQNALESITKIRELVSTGEASRGP